MKYKILWHNDPEALSKLVTEHLSNGWELHGDMVGLTTHEDGLLCLYQPIVYRNNRARPVDYTGTEMIFLDKMKFLDKRFGE